MQVEVVSADRVVWSGKAINIIAKTVEGDIGILPGHEPVLAILVPGAVEIFAEDNSREIIAVDGGFISVAHGRVSILSEYAMMAERDQPAATPRRSWPPPRPGSTPARTTRTPVSTSRAPARRSRAAQKLQ